MKYIRTYESLFTEEIELSTLEKIWFHYVDFFLCNQIVIKTEDKWYEWFIFEDRNSIDSTTYLLDEFILEPFPTKGNGIYPLYMFESFAVNTNGGRFRRSGEDLMDVYQEIRRYYPFIEEIYMRKGSGGIKEKYRK